MGMASGAQAIERRRAVVLMGCLVLIWGCNRPVNKTILTHISPLWFACVRMALAISLFLVQGFRADGIKLPARADYPIVLSVGLVQMAADAGIDEPRLGQRTGRALRHPLLH